MSETPRAEQGQTENHPLDPQDQIPDHLVKMEGIGDVLVSHANAISISLINVNGTGERISIRIARDACKCGCNEPFGRALMITPDAATARALAARLVGYADHLEAAAARQASDWLKNVLDDGR